MQRQIIIAVPLVILAALMGAILSGCGGSQPASMAYGLTGNVSALSGLAGSRAPDVQYAPAFDYNVYAADPQTLEPVSDEARTDLHGDYKLRNVRATGDLLVVAERDGVTLRAFITEAQRQASKVCAVSPDTTIAASVIQQVKLLSLPVEQLQEIYGECLAYQAANRFKYGHCAGSPSDFTSANDVKKTAQELVRIWTNEVIHTALQTRDVDDCKLMVAAGMADLAVNDSCDFKVIEAQRDKIAQRTTEGDLWTPAEAAALINQAGIYPNLGPSVSTADVTTASLRLNSKYAALAEGSRTKICAAELLMICCQTGDSAVPFRVHTQVQVDTLVTRMVPAGT
jgi:hypothetical protein